MTKEEWVSEFQTSVSNLLSNWYDQCGLQTARVKFFSKHLSMKEAMLTIADFSYKQRAVYSPDQAAAIWFHECCMPKLRKDKKAEQRIADREFNQYQYKE
jgi:hypothetical protein